ncbi:hypothetical protein [Streptococcus catagoni]|uniref:hypothetical protein n=1 Tax=Streptococcus catagoni TaxID=2654874 RepID=UPI0014099337|nr:hypothetical protein [Streptococcus catagoni]
MTFLSFSTVKADSVSVPFQAKGQESLEVVSVSPFSIGSSSINVNLGSHEYVYASMSSSTSNKIKKPEDKTVCTKSSFSLDGKCEGRSWVVSGYRADGSGSYTVQLEKPLSEGDVVTLSFADYGNMYFGQLVYIDGNTARAEEQKHQEELNRQFDEKYAEDLFKHSIEGDANKTWYQQLKESVQDSWWNFKSWWG